jgi:hypothetical protein
MKLPAAAYAVTDPTGRHRYQIELPSGQIIPCECSVTGVLDVISKPALYNWYAKTACEQIRKRLLELSQAGRNVELTEQWIEAVVAEGRKRPTAVKDEAADLGTAAHAGFEDVLAGREPKVPTVIRPAIAEFETWLANTHTEIVESELPVGSATNRFGGRLDGLGYRDGAWGIVDFKTSSGIYNEYALQTAGGYAIAVEEQYPGVLIEWADIVRFPKVAPWGSEAKPVADMTTARQAFLCALGLKRGLSRELIGPASYSTFAANAAAAEATRAGAKAKKAKATAKVGF